jgi:hypothetical protein
MPFYAYDTNNFNDDRVHIDLWIETRHLRGNPFCKVCQNELNICAEHTPAQATHFCHLNGTNCPTIQRSAEPYQHLENIPQDNELENENKNQTQANLHKIFNKCKSLCVNLNFSEFRSLFDIASQYNIWAYANINLEHIPYILLTCRNYFGARTPYRKESFYFIFSPVHGLNGLWIQAEDESDILFQVNRNTHDIIPIDIHFDLDDYSNESDLTEYTFNYIHDILE